MCCTETDLISSAVTISLRRAGPPDNVTKSVGVTARAPYQNLEKLSMKTEDQFLGII